ncbi:hypothetical protein A2U01_0021670 [Trifolium medium]|uniref:TF-B3 domain-containing protein n=1 Tax=Trifolium medium TaxID=97028 RepID=A0A392NL82_9FABA|nr:hypothetical protein [Trifolium medium]
MIVSQAYANMKKQQVLHVPPRMAQCVLRDSESIVLRTRHNMDRTTCTIRTYIREDKPEKKEMYLTDGWFEFKKANQLRKGDKLQFQLSDPPDVVVVDIVRRRGLKIN